MRRWAARIRLFTPAVALCLLALGAPGCGGGSSDTETSGGERGLATAPSELAESPPRGASPLLREVYRQFQRPKPDPEMKKRTAKVIRAGERACRGKKPIEVREEFLLESSLLDEQRKAVETRLEEAERHPSGNFVAGQLAALVYEGTLPDKIGLYGYAGCVYALSQVYKRQLEREERR